MPLESTIAYVTDIHGNVCQLSGSGFAVPPYQVTRGQRIRL